ncbi:uncharacterized protein [Typha angustifolia]|uniref:uncharacterized protein n=1 Tax=Typha angustifolia TaxID=59011 RepID=UPI003C2B8180
MALVEALVFRYGASLSGYVWAWIALLAAALGIWRVRAVASKSDTPSPPSPPSTSQLVVSRIAELAPAATPSHVEWPLRSHVEGEGTPKGRFTAYFNVEANVEEREEDEEGDDVSDVDDESPLEWEWTAVRKTRDLGWYHYQDMTALTGRVVRLWGDGGMTPTSPRVSRARRRM